MDIQWVEAKSAVPREVMKKVRTADVVLDVGAGIRPQRLIRPRVHLCVEPHGTYVTELMRMARHRPGLVVLQSTWSDVFERLPDRSIDSVFALDFIEHLTKEDGLRFLAQAERVARRQVIIFTPLGFYPQEAVAIDGWGLDGGAWQAHRSGWTPEDFGGTWEFLCCRDFHRLGQSGQPLDTPASALWAILSLDDTDRPRLVAILSACHRLLDTLSYATSSSIHAFGRRVALLGRRLRGAGSDL